MADTEKHIQHKRSSGGTSVSPKLPLANQIEYGEIAVNYLKDGETLSIKNTNGEIVTFSSDKKTSPVDLMVNITWSELGALKTNNQLVKGAQYRITDYITTTVQTDTQSANHPFDIIVTADDVNKLNENARAIQHSGDTYFANSKLEAWEIKYCLDNDTNRFAWADSTNGKGVIYYMKDEFGNECPYDFKNIQFKRWMASAVTTSSTVVSSDFVEAMRNMFVNHYHSHESSNFTLWNGDVTVAINPNGYKYFYTFSLCDDGGETYNSDDNKDVFDGSLKGYGDNMYMANVIGDYFPFDNGYYRKLNNIVFKPINTSSDDCKNNVFGNGCCDMTFGFANTIDNSFGNNCKYNSFGNYYYDNSFGNYCYNNSFGNGCHSNSFGNECSINSFSIECCSNSFGNECSHNLFGNECYYNSFGNECYRNSFGNECYDNSFGNMCYSNSFGNDCNNNSFGNQCSSNSFNYSCYSNSFGNGCISNQMEFESSYNSFGDGCMQNEMETKCENNSFGTNCRGNSFGVGASGNSFGNECRENSFVDACAYNSFGNECSGNSFVNSCTYNSFGNGCSGNTMKNFSTYNTFGNGCYNISFDGICNYNSFGIHCNYITFGNGCHGNSFGNQCAFNTFGNNCENNSFGDNCDNITFGKDYTKYVIVENGNLAITLTSTQTTSSANPLRNIIIAQGVNNTSTRKTISHNTVNDTFKTTYRPTNSQTIDV